MQKVRKAVFPVAGLGTRFLPATKAIPKEMFPILDKPLIQYAVEEARDAGIEQFIFVTGRGKGALEDHFDHSHELTHFLNARNKAEELKTLSGLNFKPGQIVYTRQQDPLGLGHAVWCARDFIPEDEHFAVILADDFIDGKTPCLTQMVKAFEEKPGNYLALCDVAPNQVSSYGIIKPGTQSGSITQILDVVEKPKPADAPSNLAVIGRYILSGAIFKHLENQKTGAGGEIQLTDAFAPLIQSQGFYGFHYEGQRYDCGSKEGWLEANIAVALNHPDISPALKQSLKQLDFNHRKVS